MADAGDKKDTKYVYHYTSEKGLEGILKDGKIKQSTEKPGDGDVAFGEGVYFTGKEPEKHSPKEILYNNYDCSAASKEPERVSRYIELKADSIGAEKCSQTERDVHLVKGDVTLKNGEFRVGKTVGKEEDT